MSRRESSGDADSSIKKEAKKTRPKLFKVFMHNDDYTTMEFVVSVLETVFHKTSTESNAIMLRIHIKGVGLCGVYPLEIAETKVTKVHALARAEGFPLRCSIEED